MDSPYLSRLARGIEPYVPGEQPTSDGLIKLNTNENPYPPSPRVEEALRGRAARLRLYPEIDARTLREIIAPARGPRPGAGLCRQRLGRGALLLLPRVFRPGGAGALPRGDLFVLPGVRQALRHPL